MNEKRETYVLMYAATLEANSQCNHQKREENKKKKKED